MFMVRNRPKQALDLTLLHSGSPTSHIFRGSTEFKDGLCGPGSAAWAAETGRPAGLPLLTRGRSAGLTASSSAHYYATMMHRFDLIARRFVTMKLLCREQEHLACRSSEVGSMSSFQVEPR